MNGLNEPKLLISAKVTNVRFRYLVTIIEPAKGKNMAKFQRLYSDVKGESQWQDVEVTLEEQTFAPPAKAIEISPPESVKQMMFLRLRSGWDEPVHPTPSPKSSFA